MARNESITTQLRPVVSGARVSSRGRRGLLRALKRGVRVPAKVGRGSEALASRREHVWRSTFLAPRLTLSVITLQSWMVSAPIQWTVKRSDNARAFDAVFRRQLVLSARANSARPAAAGPEIPCPALVPTWDTVTGVVLVSQPQISRARPVRELS